jgi:uncharacterized DUF497 family protein
MGPGRGMIDFGFMEWDDANIGHISDNGLTTEEVEDVLYSPDARPFRSRSTGRPAVIGVTSTGKTIIVIYDRDKEGGHWIIRPATAYEIED